MINLPALFLPHCTTCYLSESCCSDFRGVGALVCFWKTLEYSACYWSHQALSPQAKLSVLRHCWEGLQEKEMQQTLCRVGGSGTAGKLINEGWTYRK